MASGHGPLTAAPRTHATRTRAHHEPAVVALVSFLFLLLLIFVALPLGKVLSTSVLQDGNLTLAHYRRLFDGRAVLALRNSLLLGTVVAVIGTALGYAAAYTLVVIQLPGRRFFRTLATLPMMAPPFMIALAAIMLFGRNGVLTRLLLIPLLGAERVPDLYGFWGLVLVQTLTYFPTAMLVLVAVFAAIDPVLEDAARNLGASPARVFRDVVLPLSLPGIFSALLLLFVESLADFGNPLILGGDFQVLSVAAFLKITGEFDTAGGAALAVLLLVPATLAFIVQRRLAERAAFATLSGRPSAARRRATSAAARMMAALVCASIALFVCLFFGAVLYGSLVEVWGVAGRLTLSHYAGALAATRNALADSLLLAALATPLTGLLGMAMAYLLVRREFAGKSIMAMLALLTFAVPGTIVGIGYILAFNQPPLLLTGTATIIVALFVFRSAPIGIEAGSTALRQVDVVLEEGSASLGASPLRTFRTIVLPLISPALFTALAHSFVRSMTAISAVIFVVSGQYNLVTVSILGFVENSELARASAMCVMLVVLVALVLGSVQLLVSRLGAPR